MNKLTTRPGHTSALAALVEWNGMSEVGPGNISDLELPKSLWGHSKGRGLTVTQRIRSHTQSLLSTEKPRR